MSHPTFMDWIPIEILTLFVFGAVVFLPGLAAAGIVYERGHRYAGMFIGFIGFNLWLAASYVMVRYDAVNSGATYETLTIPAGFFEVYWAAMAFAVLSMILLWRDGPPESENATH